VSELDRHLAAVAAARHSIITRDDVFAAEGNYFHIDARVQAGRWEQVYESVYRIAGVPWTYEARVFAAICAAGDGARASHRCAARLLGYGFWTAPVEISIHRGQSSAPSKRSFIRVLISTRATRKWSVLSR
jgi:hypothetical protein